MNVDSPEQTHEDEDVSQVADLEAKHVRFLSSVSHNLRTPLTAVLGFAEVLQADTGAMRETDRADLVATIAGQAAAMSDVLEDLLVGAQAEMGILSVASVPVNLGAQLAQVVEHTRTDTRAALRVEGTATALGDPGRVRQIIRNVLRTAELHGGPNILVRLSDHDHPAFLTVISDGPGISIEDQRRIFEPFDTARRDDEEHEAFGLGLSVARQLARLMSGDLTYRHASGHSTFALSLPAHRAGGNGEHAG